LSEGKGALTQSHLGQRIDFQDQDTLLIIEKQWFWKNVFRN